MSCRDLRAVIPSLPLLPLPVVVPKETQQRNVSRFPDGAILAETGTSTVVDRLLRSCAGVGARPTGVFRSRLPPAQRNRRRCAFFLSARKRQRKQPPLTTIQSDPKRYPSRIEYYYQRDSVAKTRGLLASRLLLLEMVAGQLLSMVVDTNKLDTATKDLRNYRTMLSLNNGDRGPRKESPAAKFRSSFRKKNQKKVASRYELMASVGSFCDDVREDEETTASRSAPELSKGDANDNSVNASEPAGDVLQDLTMQDVSSPGLPMMPIPSSPSDKMITNEGAVSTSADTEVPNNTLVLEECEEMMSMASFSYDATRELSNNRPGERSCKTGTCANGEKTITKGRINPPVDDSNANDATDENNQRNGPAIVVEESDEMMSMIEFSKDDTDGLSTFYVEGPIKVHKGKQLRGRSGCATTLAPKSSDTDCLYSNSKAPSEDTAAAIAAGEAEDNEDENTSTRCHDCLQIDFSRISDSGKGNIFVQTMPKTCTNSKSEGSIGKTEMR